MTDNNEKSKFRFQGKFIHLVYKNHFTSEEIKKVFDSKIHKRRQVDVKYKIKVANESADTEHPYLHTHVLLWIYDNVNWRNSRVLDIGDVHPCFCKILSAEHWNNTWKYLDKENCILDELKGDELSNGGDNTPSLIQAIQSHKSWVSVVTDEMLSRSIKRCMKWAKEVYDAKPRDKLVSEDLILYDWQRECVKLVEEQEDGKVLWIYDEDGGNGKSVLTDWFIDNKSVFFSNGGKMSDIAYAFDNQEIVVFDLPRSSEEYTPYRAMESFKDGRLFSSKYMSCMKVFNKCKVVVFCNFLPDLTKLSKRRWQVMELKDKRLKAYVVKEHRCDGDLTNHKGWI